MSPEVFELETKQGHERIGKSSEQLSSIKRRVLKLTAQLEDVVRLIDIGDGVVMIQEGIGDENRLSFHQGLIISISTAACDN